MRRFGIRWTPKQPADLFGPNATGNTFRRFHEIDAPTRELAIQESTRRLIENARRNPDDYIMVIERDEPLPASTTDFQLSEDLASLGVRLVMIPQLEGEALHRMQGWREILEEEGQDLWCMYHWIVAAQGGKTTCIYRLADWLNRFNVPDRTGGAHWINQIPISTDGDVSSPPSPKTHAPSDPPLHT